MPKQFEQHQETIDQSLQTEDYVSSQQTVEDNRPEAQLGRALQEMANTSSQAKEGASIKASAKEKAKQRAPKQKVNNTGIPDRLKAAVEHFSELSLDEVRVHYNSDKPTEKGVPAYTNGLDIYVAPEQEKYLARELSYIIQQMKNNDSTYETMSSIKQKHESYSPNNNPTDIRESFKQGRILNGILITYKEKGSDGYYKFEYEDGTIERKQPAEVEFFFEDIGIKIFLQAVVEEGFSKEASSFLLALGVHESGFAQGNGGKEYHNMFSIMGGSKGNLSTSSGSLQKFDSWQNGFSDGLVNQIIDGNDSKGNKKFPLLRKTLESKDLSIDKLNEAFGQFNFHKHNNNKKSAPYSYDSNKEVNFGLKYANIAVNKVIPMLIIDLYRRIQDLEEKLSFSLPEQQTIYTHHINNYTEGIKLLQEAQQNLQDKIKIHEQNNN